MDGNLEVIMKKLLLFTVLTGLMATQLTGMLPKKERQTFNFKFNSEKSIKALEQLEVELRLRQQQRMSVAPANALDNAQIGQHIQPLIFNEAHEQSSATVVERLNAAKWEIGLIALGLYCVAYDLSNQTLAGTLIDSAAVCTTGYLLPQMMIQFLKEIESEKILQKQFKSYISASALKMILFTSIYLWSITHANPVNSDYNSFDGFLKWYLLLMTIGFSTYKLIETHING